jgi:DNA-binding transcriptional MerR regulator
MGAAARLTGLSPDVLRAWEKRYGVVVPVRTAGGTRRYRASDLERLRLVKAAVDGGHRIGEVARLDADELRRRLELAPAPAAPERALEAVIDALARLDAADAELRISLQLAALGPVRFAREFAVPLLEEIGEGWAAARVCIASEHLGSALLRSLLGASLRPTALHRDAPRIVFATPAGERHELGLLIAALTALGAGGSPVYLGPDLPAEELLDAVETASARALAIGIVALPVAEAERAVRTLRAGLPPAVELWVGGSRAPALALPPGVVHVDSLDVLESRVALLGMRPASPA